MSPAELRKVAARLIGKHQSIPGSVYTALKSEAIQIELATAGWEKALKALEIAPHEPSCI